MRETDHRHSCSTEAHRLSPRGTGNHGHRSAGRYHDRVCRLGRGLPAVGEWNEVRAESGQLDGTRQEGTRAQVCMNARENADTK